MFGTMGLWMILIVYDAHTREATEQQSVENKPFLLVHPPTHAPSSLPDATVFSPQGQHPDLSARVHDLTRLEGSSLDEPLLKIKEISNPHHNSLFFASCDLTSCARVCTHFYGASSCGLEALTLSNCQDTAASSNKTCHCSSSSHSFIFHTASCVSAKPVVVQVTPRTESNGFSVARPRYHPAFRIKREEVTPVYRHHATVKTDTRGMSPLSPLPHHQVQAKTLEATSAHQATHHKKQHHTKDASSKLHRHHTTKKHKSHHRAHIKDQSLLAVHDLTTDKQAQLKSKDLFYASCDLSSCGRVCSLFYGSAVCSERLLSLRDCQLSGEAAGNMTCRCASTHQSFVYHTARCTTLTPNMQAVLHPQTATVEEGEVVPHPQTTTEKSEVLAQSIESKHSKLTRGLAAAGRHLPVNAKVAA